MLGGNKSSSDKVAKERDVVEQAFERPETNLVQLSNKKLLNSHKIFGQLYCDRYRAGLFLLFVLFCLAAL